MAEPIRKSVRLALYPEQSNRNEYNAPISNIDSKYLNCLVDMRYNPITKEQIPYIVKRPGLAIYDPLEDFPGDGQFLYSYKGKLYSIVNDQLILVDTLTVIHDFHKKLIYDTSAVVMEQEFGTAFPYDYAYRAVELFVNGIEYLYITNGFEDVFVDKNGTASELEQSFNRFAASGYYKPGDKVVPTTYNNYYYIAIGTAGEVSQASTEPAWPTTLGATVTTGNVEFLCFSACTIQTVAKKYAVSTAYSVGDLIQPITETGMYYKCITGGTTDASEPTWTQIIGDTTTDNGVVFECLGYYGGKPGLALPSPVYLDTYLVLNPYASSDLNNSDPSNPVSWKATNFISADSFTSPITAIARYNNYIIAFSEKDAELFYNNANTDGSPLSRHESFLLQIGAFSQKGVLSSESVLAWVGVSSSGFTSIWMLDGFEPKEISTPWINRTIASTWKSGLSGFGIRIDGHHLFVFNFINVNHVFDVGMNCWYQWGVGSSLELIPYFVGTFLAHHTFSFDSASNDHFFMSDDDSIIYRMEKTKYDDDLEWTGTGGDYTYTAYPVTLRVVTPLVDFGSRKRKFLHSLDVIGSLTLEEDSAENTDHLLTVTWSDKDYQNFDADDVYNETNDAPVYKIDLRTRPRVAPCGSFRRRAFLLQHTGAVPLRLEAVDLVFTEGKS